MRPLYSGPPSAISRNQFADPEGICLFAWCQYRAGHGADLASVTRRIWRSLADATCEPSTTQPAPPKSTYMPAIGAIDLIHQLSKSPAGGIPPSRRRIVTVRRVGCRAHGSFGGD